MSKIKSKDTTPEIVVRKFLFSNGFRYKLNYKDLPGKPDVVLPKFKTVIFINGCFWHGHEGCIYFTIPKTRTEWWKNKIEETQKRDKKNYDELIINNWKVIVIWECELKSNQKQQTLENLLLNLLTKN